MNLIKYRAQKNKKRYLPALLGPDREILALVPIRTSRPVNNIYIAVPKIYETTSGFHVVINVNIS